MQTGTLEFDGGGSSAPGAFTVASGATLAFGGVGTFTLGAGALNTGPGALSVMRNGDLVLGGALTANIAKVSGGVLALGATTATIANFSDGGFGATVSGSGTMTVTGPASFGSGYLCAERARASRCSRAPRPMTISMAWTTPTVSISMAAGPWRTREPSPGRPAISNSA